MNPFDSSPPSRDARRRRSERTADLFDQIADTDHDARRKCLRDEVVVINLPVAAAVARRFARRGLDVEDLTQVANEALVKAVARFDPSRGKDFLSYAVPTIRGEVQRHFRDHGWFVRPSRRVQETRWRLARLSAAMTQRRGRAPTRRELIEGLGITESEYADAAAADGCFRPASLDQPPRSGDPAPGVGATVADPQDGFGPVEARAVLAPAVRDLSERDRHVLYLRFFKDLGQREIGIQIGVTQSQVSRILERILDDLRERVSAADRAYGAA